MSTKSVFISIGIVGGAMMYQMTQADAVLNRDYVVGYTSYNVLWYLQIYRRSMLVAYPYHGGGGMI